MASDGGDNWIELGDNAEPEPKAHEIQWIRLANGVLHLAWVRRLWGVLGGWLRVVRLRGVRDESLDDAG